LTRVVALAVDAADRELVLRWAAEGKLPALQGLIERGRVARLQSDGLHLPESTWPTIVTGCRPHTHGVYSWREVEPGTYQRTRRPARSPRPPFWELLREDPAAPEILLLDVPAAPYDGGDGITAVLGWGQRGAIHRHSMPDGLLDDVEQRHGTYARNLNRDVPGRPLLERAQLRSMERMAARRTEVLRDLMTSQPWDLCVAPYFESHFAGHAFHMYAARDAYLERVPRGPGLGDALLRVYQSVDAGIGELVDAAPPDTHFAIFSGFGLRPNTSGMALLPRVLAKLGYTVPTPVSGHSRRREVMRRIALTAIPRPLARAIRRRTLTPEDLEAHMDRLWLESTDWERSRAWVEAEPGSAGIRLNVAGREPSGIVEPGAEYDALCAEIATELGELTDARTGHPAIEAVWHRDELGTGANTEALPDLIIGFTQSAVLRSVRHPRAGLVKEDRADWKITEHDNEGFLIVAGPEVADGVDAIEGRIEDIAPTIMRLMGSSVPSEVDGRPLTELLRAEARREAA
jgi:predicted AlkP superfamily phosphohydrolase/phosphomutase